MQWLKDKLDRQETVCGLWLTTGSPVVAEVAGTAGFDWVLIDLEHGCGGETEALRMLQALSGSTAAPVVRVPTADSVLIKRVLDFGAAAVMAPMVERADDAAELVRRLRYPPEGIRGMTASSRASGYGREFDAYFAEANDRIGAIVQIETAAAVAEVDAIAAVPGVNVVFIGHSDLSLDLGCFGRFDAPELQRAEAQVLAACARHGKAAGMLLKPSMRLDDFKARGFRFFGLGSDLGCLKNGFKQLLAPTR